jgi:hypothetical protein
MNNLFSADSRLLIKEARRAAIDLGYDYISTLHVMIADAQLDKPGSIRGHLFAESGSFFHFYEAERIGDPSVLVDSLPLTIELEKTIKKAGDLYLSQKYLSNHIQPHHLFLAAVQLPDTLLYAAINPKETMLQNLEAYYRRQGLIPEEKPVSEGKKIWKKLFGG